MLRRYLSFPKDYHNVIRLVPLHLAMLAYTLATQALLPGSDPEVLMQIQTAKPEQVLAMAKLLRGMRLPDFAMPNRCA